MKKILFLALIFSAAFTYSQCVTYTSAVSDVTLQSTGGTSNRTAVAYYPTKNMYYSVNAGNSTYPIQTFTYTGGAALSTTVQGADYRGLWYNPNLGTIEGNSYGNGGVYTHNINQVTGYATGMVSNVAAATMPNSQSAGAYDPVNDHILYYNATTLYKYTRATNALVTSIAITGLPSTSINNYHVIYTGIPGSEVGVYDYTNKAVYFINYSTGAYVSTCQLPSTAPGASTFRFSYANNRIFLYDGTANWFGYKITNQADLLFSGNNFACSGFPLNITISGADTYTWSTGSISSSISVTPSVTTIYSVAATNSLGCTNTSNFVVSIGTSPTLTATASNTFFCGSGSTTLSASGPSSFLWSTGATSPTITETPTVTTTYTVTGSDGTGCDAVATITVIVENNPTVTVAGTNTICEGTGTSLTANGANTYTWSNGSNSQSVSITPSVNTTYTVVGSSLNGCSDSNSTAMITVSVYPSPSLSVVSSSSLLCAGTSATLSANGASTYTWVSGGNNASLVISPTVTTTYTVTGTNTVGCSATATFVQNVSNCTGIKALTADNFKFEVFPNPGDGKFTLRFNNEIETATIAIYDLSGKLLLNQEIHDQENAVDISNLENGVYSAVINSRGKASFTIKIIKQ